MRTTENNKLIAEFMNHKENMGNKGLLYHSDWNWLMEAVHKCLLICHNDMLNEWEAGFSDSFFSMDINCMYSEVVRFIEWYNKQNK